MLEDISLFAIDEAAPVDKQGRDQALKWGGRAARGIGAVRLVGGGLGVVGGIATKNSKLIGNGISDIGTGAALKYVGNRMVKASKALPEYEKRGN